MPVKGAAPINYCLVSIMLLCQLITQQYESRASQKNTSVIKVATMKIHGRFPLHMQRKPSCESTLLAVSKDEWYTNEDTG